MILVAVLYFFLGVLPWLMSPTNGQKPPDASNFSILGVTIDQDNLATLQKKLGPVKKCHITEHGDIAGYTDSKENVVFEFGEIGGGEVTGFYLSSHRQATGCPLSPLPSRIVELTTKAGVHLGMTQQEFVHVIGSAPSRRTGDQWKYDWTLEAKYTEEEKRKAAAAGYSLSDTYLIGITIDARFSEGILQYLSIAKVEST